MTTRGYILDRPQKLFVVCTAIFLTALVVAEATASKFFTAFDLPFTINILGHSFDSVVMTAGVIAFPITFIVTDLLNEYYGKRGIRFVTWVGMAMVVFQYLILQIALEVPTAPFSQIPDDAFRAVFGATGRIIFGSLAAYAVGQVLDITLFHWLRGLTGGRYLWLRATGSTLGSQFVDTIIVLSVAFAGRLAFQEILAISLFNYLYKVGIAILITPLIYGAHWVMDLYLGKETAHRLVDRAGAVGQPV